MLESLYTDQALVAKYPYLPVLKTSIENAVPRPVTPFYPAVTKAIQDNAYAAIKGEKTVDQALKDMQAAIAVRQSAADPRTVRLECRTPDWRPHRRHLHTGAGAPPGVAVTTSGQDSMQRSRAERRAGADKPRSARASRPVRAAVGCCSSPRPSSSLAIVIVYPLISAVVMSFQKDAGLDPATGLFVAGRQRRRLSNYTHWLLQQCAPDGGP